jgi:hypothetical protein
MSFHERFDNPTGNKIGPDKTFGYTFAAVFLILAVAKVQFYFLSVSALLVLISKFKPSLLRPANRVWSAVGEALHKLTSPLFLAITFFGVFCFFGLLMRAVGQRPLQMSFDRKRRSYWRDCSSSKFEDQF